ncbi:MAG: MFS transporter, partial [Bacillota bacterium]|nr:MFS transporter [Bacillota bacterium]
MSNLSRLMVALSGTVFLTVLNGTMFNVALPAISRDFTLSPAEVSWVVVGYIAVFAIGAATYGKLADIYPVRWLLPLGLGLFALGSILGFLSTNYPLVIAARLIQAAGGAAVPALGMIVATRYFDPSRRGQALGLIASTVAFGGGIGPIAGGFITQYLGWHYLFLVSLLSLIALPFVLRYLPREERRQGTFDTPGAVFLAAGVSSVLLGINLNPLFLIVSVVSFVLFIRRVKQAPEPFVRVDLLQN